MATKTDSALVTPMTTDAHFRAIATFVHDLLVTTGGWVNTSDTGQVDLTTVTKPAGANTKAGYKVYRMADTLQSTSPLYMKLHYGTAGGATAPGIWFTLSSSTNGAGGPTGTVYWNDDATTVPTCSSNPSAAVASIESRGAAGTGWAVFRLFDQAGANLPAVMGFAIERTKDSSGADTASGWLLHWMGSNTGVWTKQLYIPAGTAPPTAENGLQMIVSSNNPSALGADVGISVPIPVYGYARQPGLNLIAAKSSDVSASTSLAFTFYGATHTYLFPGSTTVTQANSAAAAGNGITNTRVAIRYE